MPEIHIDKRSSCLLKIRGAMNSLAKAEKRVACYICDNPSEVVRLTINELTGLCNSSYATVNRFCRKIGYSGYKEMKADLINDIANNQDSDDISDIVVTPDMTTAGICEKVYSLAFKILEDSLSIVDIDVVDKAVEALSNAKRIFFTGTGTSGLSARYAYSKFFRIRLPCYAEEDTTLKKLLVSLTGEGDVLFAISSSGRSRDIVECARIAKCNGATVISLSDFSISPISKISDINLYTTPRNVNAFLNIDMPLTIGQLAIIDMLYICCCKALGEKAASVYAKTKEAAASGKI